MHRKIIFFLLLVIVMSTFQPAWSARLPGQMTNSQPAAASQDTTPAAQTAAKPITAYYASWSAYNGYTPLNIPAASLTYVNYAFAKIGSDLKIALGDPCIDPSNLAQMKQLKQANPQLKTLISIGGWSDSGKFSDAALTDSNRTAFADSVAAFIRLYDFDGVDIDWEYPVSGGLSSNINRSVDCENFTLLLKKLRETLDAQGKMDGQTYLLTIAGGADSSYAKKTQLSEIAKYVDRATIMTYDIHGPWDSRTDLNAPLYAPSESSPQYQWSADQAVKLWISKGFPASKIMLGIPFYGYIYTGVSGGGTGLYKCYQKAASLSYDCVRGKYSGEKAFSTHVHSDSLVPWIFNGSTFISYDDETSVAEKAKYIARNQLAGASVWELSQNRGGELLNALTNNLK